MNFRKIKIAFKVLYGNIFLRKKVFGIGLPKTGQTSLATAMQIIGYHVVQYPYYDYQIKSNNFAIDIPVALRYKELDKQFPNSKFILTTREYKSWIKSIKNHYRNNPARKRHPAILKYRELFWGTIHFNQKIMTKIYYKHNQEVLEYFKNRKNDLLILDVDSPNKWKKICSFLSKNAPAIKYPNENIGKYI